MFLGGAPSLCSQVLMFVGKQGSVGGEQIGGYSELVLQWSGLLKKIGDEHQGTLRP